MCWRYADVTLNVCQFVRPSRSDVVLKLSYKLVTKLFHHLLGPSFSRNVVFWAKSVLQNSDSSTLTRALYTGLVGLRKIRCSRQMFQPTYPNVSTVNWRKLKDIWIAAYVLHEGGFAWKRRRIWHILAWIRMFWAIKHRNPSRGLPCMRVQSDFRLNFDGFRRHGVCSFLSRVDIDAEYWYGISLRLADGYRQTLVGIVSVNTHISIKLIHHLPEDNHSSFF